jgi:MATE family multidrug resistance protein
VIVSLNATSRSPNLLPGQRVDAQGHTHVHWYGVWLLAAPMIANNAIQVVLNLTDTWFIGGISTQALAAMGSVQWLTLVAIMLFGGVGLAVQTSVAQSFGAKRFVRASQAAWTGLWASLVCTPLFACIAIIGPSLLHPFHLDAGIESLALQFWQPRLFGASLAVALWAVLGFFNGIGRPRVSLTVTAIVGVANIALNWLFIIRWHSGIAGSAWATNISMLIGVAIGIGTLMSAVFHSSFRSRLTWRLRGHLLNKQWRLGFPMGLMLAGDVVGVALFQLMQVRLGTVDGAVTQIAMMLTSIAFMPAVGISLAGTTLVGQSIGAGDRDWAYRVGNAVILLATGYMALAGFLLGAFAPWLMPLFVSATDTNAQAVIAMGTTILWIAAAYQIFDGLNISAGCCLRGAGDAVIPAILVIVLSWFMFVPAAHVMTFHSGEGWFDVLPQLGFGVVGGWTTLLVYVVLLGVTMQWRWRARTWQRVRIE